MFDAKTQAAVQELCSNKIELAKIDYLDRRNANF